MFLKSLVMKAEKKKQKAVLIITIISLVSDKCFHQKRAAGADGRPEL